MSCEGPLLQVNPHHNPTPSPCYSPAAVATLDPRNSHIFRARAASASGHMLQVPGSEDSHPTESRSTPGSPTQLETNSLTLPLGSAFSRSASLPRGVRGRSAEPEDVLSSSDTAPRLRSALSPRFIRRTATVDTNNLHKEEFEEFMLVNQYKVVGIIGSGSYGIVHKATTEENNTYAMKIVAKSRLRRKSFPVRPGKLGPRQATLGARPTPTSRMMRVQSPLDNIHREIAILKKLDHPNVVKLIEVLDDPREDDLIMVFEYIQKGSIMKEISPSETMSEAQAREYFIDLILGLEYLHSHHIIHRDIKPDNLLLDDDNHIKIADFGVSEEIDTSESHLSRSAGTPAFTAPECLDAANKLYKGQAVDIWAAGITLFCFIYGKVPFKAAVITELHDMIRTQPAQFPASPEISPELKDLFGRLLEKDATKRVTIPELRKHPWVCSTERYIPSKEENCDEEISVNMEEIATAFKTFRTPIHILVMIKQMAKKRSFGNPYSPKSSPRTSPRGTPSPSPSHSPTSPHPPTSPSPFKRRNNLLKSHQTPTICVDSTEIDP